MSSEIFIVVITQVLILHLCWCVYKHNNTVPYLNIQSLPSGTGITRRNWSRVPGKIDVLLIWGSSGIVLPTHPRTAWLEMWVSNTLVAFSILSRDDLLQCCGREEVANGILTLEQHTHFNSQHARDAQGIMLLPQCSLTTDLRETRS